jgi:hypothetical protein
MRPVSQFPAENSKDFCSESNLFLSHMIKWFNVNKLVLNMDKKNITNFIIKNSSHSTLHIGYIEKYIQDMVNTKFLHLQIEKHLNWKSHIEQIIPKLSAACYAIRLMVHKSNINTHIDLLCIFSFCYKILNNFWG